MTTGIHNSQAKFERALELLHDPDTAINAELIYGLSDLSDEQMEGFHRVWNDVPTDRRLNLVQWLVDTAETNFELDFTTIIRVGLDDDDHRVRKAAIEGVFEESPLSMVDRVARLAQDDPFSEVRAAAASALGPFILQGELGKLPTHFSVRLQDTVLALHNNLNEDLDVRRRALEAIANCGREGVTELIREAYYADDLPMRLSAVFAMGRSYDEVWTPHILEELASDYPEMRYEAARASGELELQKALPRLIELAYEDDREVQEAAIWALGEIGGKIARTALSQLAALADDAGDDELIEAIAEAQSAANLVGEELLPLFDFSDYEDALDEDEDDAFDGYAAYGDDFMYDDDEDDDETGYFIDEGDGDYEY